MKAKETVEQLSGRQAVFSHQFSVISFQERKPSAVSQKSRYQFSGREAVFSFQFSVVRPCVASEPVSDVKQNIAGTVRPFVDIGCPRIKYGAGLSRPA